MKKRIITLLLCLSMVFSMAVPAFAAEPSVAALKGISYCALGDSIPAGCTMMNDNETNNPYYLKFRDGNLEYTKDENQQKVVTQPMTKKSFSVYAVPRTYVYKFAKKIKANDRTSFNGSYPGLRAKDLCSILGIKSKKYPKYTDDHGIMDGSAPLTSFDFLKSKKTQYQQAIANADVITVTLGENDFSSFIMGQNAKLNTLLSTVNTLIAAANSDEDKAMLQDLAQRLKELSSGKKPDAAYAKETWREILILGSKYSKITATVVKGLNDSLVTAIKEDSYFWNLLMDYINQHKKKNAIVIATTLPNPFGGLKEVEAKFGGYSLHDMIKLMLTSFHMDDQDITLDLPEGITLDGLAQPFTDGMNLRMAAVSKKYNYNIANINNVILTSFENYGRYQELVVKEYQGTINNTERAEMDSIYSKWTLLHPTEDGHSQIATTVYNTYKKAKLKKVAKDVVAASHKR